jgi:hypothetical protein
MQPDGSSNISQLASICDNLLSNKAQRNQELQSISDLLDGIKQLQAAQQASCADRRHACVCHWQLLDAWGKRSLQPSAAPLESLC